MELDINLTMNGTGLLALLAYLWSTFLAAFFGLLHLAGKLKGGLLRGVGLFSLFCLSVLAFQAHRVWPLIGASALTWPFVFLELRSLVALLDRAQAGGNEGR